MQINKKAMSNIVTVVILILVSLTALAIIGVLINNLIQKNLQMSPEILCLNENTKPQIILKSACYDSVNKDIIINIIRNSEKPKVTLLEFLLNFEKESQKFSCQCANCKILKIGEKNYYITSETKPKTVTLLANKCLIGLKEITDC